ncbi:hypothetical protein ACQP1S_06320 [Micromonospora matsumotoense]|uniref:hypothetical protein n=1 Tax=Micromonospora matsumotoense TaxID=121616 RepID=UPI003D921480
MTQPDDDVRLDEQHAAAVRYLVAHADQVGRASGREPMREALLLTRGRWPRRHGWPVVPRLGTPWQDTVSAERHGWRCRAAYLPGLADMVFEVDYQICRRCRLEQPYTLPRYQRRGLARASLAALRVDQPGLSWHTLRQHLYEGRAFWIAVGQDCRVATDRGRCVRTSRRADGRIGGYDHRTPGQGQQVGDPGDVPLRVRQA